MVDLWSATIQRIASLSKGVKVWGMVYVSSGEEEEEEDERSLQVLSPSIVSKTKVVQHAESE